MFNNNNNNNNNNNSKIIIFYFLLFVVFKDDLVFRWELYDQTTRTLNQIDETLGSFRPLAGVGPK